MTLCCMQYDGSGYKKTVPGGRKQLQDQGPSKLANMGQPTARMKKETQVQTPCRCSRRGRPAIVVWPGLAKHPTYRDGGACGPRAVPRSGSLKWCPPAAVAGALFRFSAPSRICGPFPFLSSTAMEEIVRVADALLWPIQNPAARRSLDGFHFSLGYLVYYQRKQPGLSQPA
jgi:hypothetical protein